MMSYLLKFTLSFYLLCAFNVHSTNVVNNDSDQTISRNIRTISTNDMLTDKKDSFQQNLIQKNYSTINGIVYSVSTSELDSYDDNGFLKSSFNKLSSNKGILDRNKFKTWGYLVELLNDRSILPYMIDESLDLVNITSKMNYFEFINVMKNLDDLKINYQAEMLDSGNMTMTDIELLDMIGPNDDEVQLIFLPDEEGTDVALFDYDIDVDIDLDSDEPSLDPSNGPST